MNHALIATVTFAAETFGCLLMADFIGGLLHWAEDSWLAPGRNALLDRFIVAPNIEHHQRPGSIRAGTYWETNCVVIVLSGVAAALAAVSGVHWWEVYLIIALTSQSNQIHAWAHTSNPPAAIAALQRLRILQTAAEHAVHHRRPYGVRYCTTTSLLNPVLDRSHFWRGLEWLGQRLGARLVRATPARNGY